MAGTKAADPMVSFAMQDAFKCEAGTDLKQESADAVKGIEKPLLKACLLYTSRCV